MSAAIAKKAATPGESSVAEHRLPAQELVRREYVTIPCRVSDGMFSSEWAVEVEAADGQVGSLFAHRSLVSGLNDGIGRLRVRWIRDDGLDRGTVLLPQESPEIGLWLQVRKDQVI